MGNVKSGLVLYGPLLTNSVLTTSQRAGQSAGSMGAPWISGIEEGEVSAGGSVVEEHVVFVDPSLVSVVCVLLVPGILDVAPSPVSARCG